MLGIGDALLQQVRTASRSLLQQSPRIDRRIELTQEDDADLRVALAQTRRDLETFVNERWWHANVRDHDIWLLGLHSREYSVQVTAGRNDLDRRVFARLEQAAHTLTDQKIVSATMTRMVTAEPAYSIG